MLPREPPAQPKPGERFLASSPCRLICIAVSQEPFVCWFLFLRRFLVEIWVGYGWGRGVSCELLRRGGGCSSLGAGAGTSPELSLLELPEQHLMRAVLSRQASWLVCCKREIISGCLKEGEKVGERTGHWRTCTTSRASKPPPARSSSMQQKQDFWGGFHIDLHAFVTLWMSWDS